MMSFEVVFVILPVILVLVSILVLTIINTVMIGKIRNELNQKNMMQNNSFMQQPLYQPPLQYTQPTPPPAQYHPPR